VLELRSQYGVRDLMPGGLDEAGFDEPEEAIGLDVRRALEATREQPRGRRLTRARRAAEDEDGVYGRNAGSGRRSAVTSGIRRSTSRGSMTPAPTWRTDSAPHAVAKRRRSSALRPS
jgi:hypothetical protein